ncbi:hypothetical protein JVU11DRAFT_6307 [Chiua virens]|nr:hypothetical protein JVU11DRAFT_6307 [Chiua virens]
MSVPTCIATPGRVSAIAPIQWIPAFAYTPDSISARSTSYLDQTVDDPEGVEDDALPTQFQPRTIGGTFHPSLDAVSGEGSDAYSISDPALMVPAKRKRRSRGKGISPSVSNVDTPCEQVSHLLSSALERMLAIRALVFPIPLPCPRSRRFMLDAVEIVNKRSQSGRRRTVHARSTESARMSASSHYPSPPLSCGREITTIHDSTSLVVHQITEHASPSQLTPLKVSKYFPRTSASATRPKLDNVPVLTLPSSPISIIPESSGLEYLPPTVQLGKPAGNNSGLFDDLMIMLRRLKPILIQGVCLTYRFVTDERTSRARPLDKQNLSRTISDTKIQASHDDLVALLRPLGLYNKRAQWLKDVSQRILQDRQASTSSWEALLSEAGITPGAPHLRYPGVGPYALDSLRIFCTRDKDAWMRVMPRDKELVRYLRWRWAVEKGKVWYPEGIGVIGDVDVPYLITLVDELATHYDDAIGGEGYMYHFDNDLCDMLNGNTVE